MAKKERPKTPVVLQQEAPNKDFLDKIRNILSDMEHGKAPALGFIFLTYGPGGTGSYFSHNMSFEQTLAALERLKYNLLTGKLMGKK